MNITHESLYAAWHKVGADVAGLKWSDFVAAIEAQPATQQAEPATDYVDRLINRLMMTPQSMSDQMVRELHREAAAMLHLQKKKPAAQQAEQQCNETDELLRNLGLDPEHYRTEGGYVNHRKVKAAIRHPENYPQLGCAHEFVDAPASLGGRICKKCSRLETPKAQPATQPDWESLRDPAVLHANLLRGIPAKLSADQLRHLLGEQPVGEPIAWEATHYGIIKYVTDSRYKKFSATVQGYYKPFKCSSCTTPQPRKLTDDDLEDIAVAARSGNLFDLRRAVEAAIGGQA